VRTVHENGGAMCEVRILRAICRIAAEAKEAAKDHAGAKATPAPEESWQVDCGLDLPDTPSATGPGPCGHDAYAIWKPFSERRLDDKKEEEKLPKFWRASAVMGYGDEGDASCPIPFASVRSGLPRADVLILDDSGYAFRSQTLSACWLLPADKASQPAWVVLKTSHPLAQGDLWREVTSRFADSLVTIISANDLRRECVDLSEGLSWDRVVENVGHELEHNYSLAGLTQCRHVLIVFGADGVLWLDRTETPVRATLIYDAAGCEGEWAGRFDGRAFGALSCLVAATGHQLMLGLSNGRVPDLASAAMSGLAAIRRLHRNGHGEVGERPPTGFPAEDLAREILRPKCIPPGGFACSVIPWPMPTKPANGAPWMIVDSMQHVAGSGGSQPLFGLARRIVCEGKQALKSFPHAHFGKLTTVDRNDIEHLRAMRRAIEQYVCTPSPERPLSIGVFGPPGAGKSFGVKQIAYEVLGKESWLEFNLSQFNDAGELNGAFHQVRDRVLQGKTPVVFWDEFDSQELRWLQYLLAPMQDGRFQDGNLQHAIGKCIFIVAGGTRFSYRKFGEPPTNAAALEKFKLRKVPDLHSRLDCYYDVLGPNPRSRTDENLRDPDPADLTYPLRRALFIRGQLDVGDRILDGDTFDPGLLTALLEAPYYTHGSRSLEKIVAALRPGSDGASIRRSSLPPPSQLAMHVDEDAFRKLMERNYLFQSKENLDTLAAAIHATWLGQGAADSSFRKDFEKLSAEIKEDNRAAAARIPEILALAGLRIVKGGATPTHATCVPDRLEQSLEPLAEAEHVGWMSQRLKNGWRYAKDRSDERKLHPALVPYGQLSEEDKNRDRGSVRKFPEMVKLAGFQIELIAGVPPAPASADPE